MKTAAKKNPGRKKLLPQGADDLEIKTQTELARALGVAYQGTPFSQPTLANWKRKYPDAPTGLVLSEWLAFVEKHELGFAGNRVTKSREELIKANLAADLKWKNLRIAQAERTLVPLDDVKAYTNHLGYSMLHVLRSRLENSLPPRVLGLDVVDVRQICRETLDSILTDLNDRIKEWADKQESLKEGAARATEPEDATA